MATHSLGTLIFWLVTAIVLFSAFAWLARSLAGMHGMTERGRRDNVLGNDADSNLGPDPSLRQMADDEVARYRFLNEERGARDMDKDSEEPFKKAG